MEKKLEATDENMEKAIHLISDIIRFVRSTIINHEEIFYKATEDRESYPNMKFITKEILKTSKFANVVLEVNEKYFNTIYDAFLNNEDNDLIKFMQYMMDILDHSPNCIYSIMAKMCVEMHRNMKRELFDTSSLEKYTESLNNQLSGTFTPEFIVSMSPFVLHVCSGKKTLDPVPPGKKMFNFIEYNSKDNNRSVVDTDDDSSNNEKKNKKKDIRGTCVSCGSFTRKICSGCKTRRHFICSPQCQKKDWSIHKEVCEKSASK